METFFVGGESILSDILNKLVVFIWNRRFRKVELSLLLTATELRVLYIFSGFFPTGGLLQRMSSAPYSVKVQGVLYVKNQVSPLSIDVSPTSSMNLGTWLL